MTSRIANFPGHQHNGRAQCHQAKGQPWPLRKYKLAGLLVGLAVALLLMASQFSASSSASDARANREWNSIFALPVDGTITIKTAAYAYASTTQTATLTRQIFTSGDCSSGGGSVDTVTGVDSITGLSFTVPAGQSVQVSATNSGGIFTYETEQHGPFVTFGVADPAYQSSFTTSGDGHQVCIQGFAGPGERIYPAYFNGGIQLFDSCGTERYSYRPGETITIKVSGGIINNGVQTQLLGAGGAVNECGFFPPAGQGPFYVTTDPYTTTFTLPSSDADIPPVCISGNSTTIFGNWRIVAYDVNICGCNRSQANFTLANDAPLPSCTLTCPGDMSVSNDPGTCGAVVNYTTPTAPNPATVTCDHPSGSTFPVGATLVTCTSSAGPSCSFNVTVTDAENPTITAPPTVNANTDANACVATGVALGSPATGDNCSVANVTNDAPSQFPLGSTTVTWTVTDNHGHTATATQTVNVADHTAPTLSVPADSNVAANASCQAVIPNVVSGSSAADNCGAVTVTQSPTAGTLVGLGAHTITVTATDTAGNHTDKPVGFNVIDNTPPSITLNGNVIEMWPPNHQYQTISVSDLVASAADNCDPTVGLGSVYISQVTSDEVENSKGDGDTLNDIVIGGDCKSVQLRVERDGGGNGRVYTIIFKVKDAANNVTTALARVYVPKSQNGGPAIDDGPHYAVNGCP
jgi:hypothetical protein